MNYLVVYYSRTGLTRKVGESISDLLHCDRDEIKEKNPAGYPAICYERLTKKRPEIFEPSKDPANYDLVVIGTPVWFMGLPGPVRSYMFRERGRLRQVAFYATQGVSGSGNAFREMERICGRKPVQTMEINRRDLKDGECIAKVREYIENIEKKL